MAVVFSVAGFMFAADATSGFRLQASGFGVQGSGLKAQGSGFRVQGAGFRTPDSGFTRGGAADMLPCGEITARQAKVYP